MEEKAMKIMEIEGGRELSGTIRVSGAKNATVALETKKPKSWCKSISAFANCYGGKLVFGVANDDALVGLSDAEGDAEKISEIIKTHLNPIPEFKLSFEKDNDKTFVIVEVMKGQLTTITICKCTDRKSTRLNSSHT